MQNYSFFRKFPSDFFPEDKIFGYSGKTSGRNFVRWEIISTFAVGLEESFLPAAGVMKIPSHYIYFTHFSKSLQ